MAWNIPNIFSPGTKILSALVDENFQYIMDILNNSIISLNSPAFTGTPTAPTAAVDTNSSTIATTAFVLGQASAVDPANISIDIAHVGTSFRYSRDDHQHANIITTQAVDTSNTTIASTEFVINQASAVTPQPLAITAAIGTSKRYARADHAHIMPTLNEVKVPTVDLDLNNKKIINLANPVANNDAVNLQTMTAAIAAASSAVTSVNTLTGEVVLTTANIPENTNLYYTNTRADARVQNASGTVSPSMDGTATVGISSKWAHEDHIHPSDTTKANITFSNITATTDNLTQGSTNKYFSNALAQSAVVVQTISAGDTAHATSSDVLYTNLNLKLNKASNLSDLTSVSAAQTNLGVYSSITVDTLLAAKAPINNATFTGNTVIANTGITNIGIRGGGVGAEGGQINIGYGNNQASSITGPANATWVIDVDSSDNLRCFSVSPVGAVKLQSSTNPTTGIMNFYSSPTIPTAAPGDNSNNAASTGFVANAISGLTATLFATYAALRAYSGTAINVLITDPLAKGTFIYDSTDTTSADNGCTIIVTTTGSRRYKRIYNGYINPQWLNFSSTNTAANNTAALNAAVLLGPVVIPDGTYAIGQTGATGYGITLPANSIIIGNPRKVVLTTASGTYTTFKVTGSNVRITGIDLNNTSKTAGWDGEIACGASDITETVIDDFISTASKGGWTDSGTSIGKHYRTYIASIVGGKYLALAGKGIQFTRAFAYTRIGKAASPPDLALDFNGSAAPNNTAISIDGTALKAAGLTAVGGIYIAGSVLGTAGTTAQIGYVITNISDIDMTGSTADTLGGSGFIFTSVNNLDVSNIKANLCNDHAILFDACTNVIGASPLARGRNTVSGTASKAGIKIQNACSVFDITGPKAFECTGNGLDIATGCTEVSISNPTLRANTLKGLVTGTTGVNTIQGGIINGNTAGNYTLGAANQYLVNTILASGALVNVTGPAIG